MPLLPEKNRLSLGFSPCPNDTFIFHALVHGVTCCGAPNFEDAVLADVETLNEWALAGRLDVTKLSFHALGHVLDRYVLLMAGSALGRGCGPLLVARENFSATALPRLTIAIPGRYTTAALLLQMYSPVALMTKVMRFDEIMPAIVAGEVDAGVIIHESRFTFREHGLLMLQDLGAWWEQATGFPIPLGGIAAKRSLGKEKIQAIDRCIRASVSSAFAAPEAGMSYIRRHAQELDDKVIKDHIGLYVNPFSVDLGEEGVAAVREFLARGRLYGGLPRHSAALPLISMEL
ncbi:MAG: 1,4-dihydroxy-6-naphthoate synthase [Desulfobulbaceae bacterium]|nr:1,4-dihydroxy-6-naphthoate synthase [Desulfobulbaceae bacterium]HIJ90039.1 1,4-dihydroxy-6-naphthoate synthase [Deltaproteobacteria bacterium]